LEIKPDISSHKPLPSRELFVRKPLANFSSLTHLRVLGLMDVTMHTIDSIPEDNEERRVRTSASEVNKMAYGVADHLGKNESLNMLDLVQPNFRDRPDEAIFAMFGRAQPIANNNRIAKFLHDHFIQQFTNHLSQLKPEKDEGVPDALRRTFLKLNKLLHEFLYSTNMRKMSQSSASSRGTSVLDTALLRSGVSGLVMYIVDKTLYIANAGNALAVISRGGVAQLVSRKHDPFDRGEISRIRSAEGWVTPKGLVNEEVDVSRSFGFYHLLPVVNARPDIVTWELSNQDEFVILANRGLWDYVSYQNAVEIAGTEKGDPMTAAQKLRDFAISYGAEGSTMIMVVCVADLFNDCSARKRQATVDSILDPEGYTSLTKRKKKDDIGIQKLDRIGDEIEPPIGHIALVFSDIRNSTHLWEVNPGMPTALRLHNNLLRRQLRYCGGYEVKSEGDSFMCSFPNAITALWWCLTVQIELLKEPWPLEILECEDGKEILDSSDRIIARGLSVRMGVHCGEPFYEPDPITKRMDYFGSMVNRSARISGVAHGGQITCSADVVREINAKIFETEPETDIQPAQAIHAIKGIGIKVVSVGETKLKGLEMPESLSLVYPTMLEGRQGLKETEAASGSRVQFSTEQMREVALLCVRLENLSTTWIIPPPPGCEGTLLPPYIAPDEEESRPRLRDRHSDVLLPGMNPNTSYADLMMLLNSLCIRIVNAHYAMSRNLHFSDILAKRGDLDARTMRELMSILGNGLIEN
jgi:adenylate cyclase